MCERGVGDSDGGKERNSKSSCHVEMLLRLCSFFGVGHLFSATPASLSVVDSKLATKTIY